MNWEDLRYFLAVHRTRSHKAAGRQLGVDPTTVSRRLVTLERSLGAKLFVRTPEALQATRAGERLFEHAERVEAELFAAERALEAGDGRVEGQLRVTGPDGFVHYALMPVLADLRRLHPKLTLELRSDSRVLDLTRQEADVAIRLGRPREASLVTRRLGTVSYGLYASQKYLDARGCPRTTDSLATHEWIGFDTSLDESPQVRWVHRLVEKPRYVFRSNSTTTQVLACVDGLGLALFPSYVAAREPSLKRLFARSVGPERDLWSVVHEDLRTSARVGAFLAFVTARCPLT